MKYPASALLLVSFSLGVPLFAADKGMHREMTAVYSVVQPGYERVRSADGGFAPETYVFGEGEFDGAAGADKSFERLTFMDVARIMTAPLADQNYVNSLVPEETDLLIMVHWGSTRVDTNIAFGQSSPADREAFQNSGAADETGGAGSGLIGAFQRPSAEMETYLMMSKIHDELAQPAHPIERQKARFLRRSFGHSHLSGLALDVRTTAGVAR